MMDKTLAGLLGVFGVLLASTPGHAALQNPPAQSMLQAPSSAEVLRPLPNALATMNPIGSEEGQSQIELAQIGPAVRDLLGVHHRHDHHYYHRRYVHRPHHDYRRHDRHYDHSVIRR